MPISILGLARAHDGDSENHTVRLAQLSDIDLQKDIQAQVIVTKLSHDLFSAHVTSHVELYLECHRCLTKYSPTIAVNTVVYFSDHVTAEQWPILNNAIDIEEPLRQEVLFLLPAQQVCGTNCTGIQYTT